MRASLALDRSDEFTRGNQQSRNVSTGSRRLDEGQCMNAGVVYKEPKHDPRINQALENTLRRLSSMLTHF